MQAAPTQAEETGDAVPQSRCLTYLTVLYRKRSQWERVRHLASRSPEVATGGQVIEYSGMAGAGPAPVAWREEDLAQAQTDGQDIGLRIHSPAARSITQRTEAMSDFDSTRRMTAASFFRLLTL